MFTAMQCAQFASCLGGGHKNYEGYNQSEKSVAGSSADNPEPEYEYKYNKKGLFTALLSFFLLTALTGFIGYEIANSISIPEDEVMPARICHQIPADTDKDEVTVQIVSEERIISDDCMVAKIVLSDGSVVNDTIHEKTTNWE